MALARAQPRRSIVCCPLASVSDGGEGDGVGASGGCATGGVAIGGDDSSGGMVSTTSPSAGGRCADAADDVATIIPMSAARETTTAAPLLHDRNHFATRLTGVDREPLRVRI